MNVRRFFGPSAREVLQQVRQVLGADAVILSNRPVDGGLEMTALANDDVSAICESAPAETAAQDVTLAPLTREPTPIEAAAVETPNIDSAAAHRIMNEIQLMRGLLEEQLAVLAWGDMERRCPTKSKTLGLLLRAGFSPSLSRALVRKVPAKTPDGDQLLQKLRKALASELNVTETDHIVKAGGVYALIGPTGVGKTTTAAKLAARCVMRHGAKKVALITADSYRIGGHEQLRIYGKLLGLPVRAVKDTEDLKLTLEDLREKHVVLIDTVGMGQRDEMVAEQLQMLTQCGTDVKRLLLLNATSNGQTLDDVVRAYEGTGLHGCVITKLDEAACLGTIIDTVVRRELNVHYVADGQRVPEDLHVANAESLLRQVFSAEPVEPSFDLKDADCAALMSGDARVPFLDMRRAGAVVAGAAHA